MRIFSFGIVAVIFFLFPVFSISGKTADVEIRLRKIEDAALQGILYKYILRNDDSGRQSNLLNRLASPTLLQAYFDKSGVLRYLTVFVQTPMPHYFQTAVYDRVGILLGLRFSQHTTGSSHGISALVKNSKIVAHSKSWKGHILRKKTPDREPLAGFRFLRLVDETGYDPPYLLDGSVLCKLKKRLQFSGRIRFRNARKGDLVLIRGRSIALRSKPGKGSTIRRFDLFSGLTDLKYMKVHSTIRIIAVRGGWVRVRYNDINDTGRVVSGWLRQKDLLPVEEKVVNTNK